MRTVCQADVYDVWYLHRVAAWCILGLWNCLAVRAGKTHPEVIMDEIIPTTRPVPAGWLEALARSDAEVASGLTVPAAVVHRRIRDSLARIEEKRAGVRREAGDRSGD